MKPTEIVYYILKSMGLHEDEARSAVDDVESIANQEALAYLLKPLNKKDVSALQKNTEGMDAQTKSQHIIEFIKNQYSQEEIDRKMKESYFNTFQEYIEFTIEKSNDEEKKRIQETLTKIL